MPHKLPLYALALFCFGLVLGSSPIRSQLLEGEQVEEIPFLSLEAVLDGYYQAVGGEEAWLAVETSRITGTIAMGPGAEATFVVYSQRPDRHRVEFTSQGLTGIQVIDGDSGWQLMPFLGRSEPEPLSAEMVEQIGHELDMEGPLVNWTKKGYTLEMLGPTEVQGKGGYQLRVSRVNGLTQMIYLDADTFLPFLMETTMTLQGRTVESEVRLGDYREVGGLTMAHTIERRPKGQPGGQQIRVETVELDVDLSDVDFARPGSLSATAGR